MSGSSHTDVILAGAAAAFTVDLLIYPLDTLKTRQQSRDFVGTFASSSSAQAQKPQKQKIFRGLYQGIGIVVLATLPAAGTFFTTYEASKNFLGRHFSSSRPSSSSSGGMITLPQPIIHASASALAECASCLVLTPAEVIKQNAQMIREEAKTGGKSSSKTPSSSLRSRLSNSTSLLALRQLGGLDARRRLLSGYTALVARNLPFTAIQFPIFEWLRERIWDFRQGKDKKKKSQENGPLLETGLVTGVSAGLGGSFSALITTPMDVVKTRMMLYAPPSSSSSSSSSTTNKTTTAGEGGTGTVVGKGKDGKGKGKGSLAVAREVLAERGIPGLFRGAVLRSVWTAVGSGLYLGTYEAAKVWLTRGG